MNSLNQNWIATITTSPKENQKCLVVDPRGGLLNITFKNKQWINEATSNALSFIPKFWKERPDTGWI